LTVTDPIGKVLPNIAFNAEISQMVHFYSDDIVIVEPVYIELANASLESSEVVEKIDELKEEERNEKDEEEKEVEEEKEDKEEDEDSDDKKRKKRSLKTQSEVVVLKDLITDKDGNIEISFFGSDVNYIRIDVNF
jgi:hypothetical protein